MLSPLRRLRRRDDQFLEGFGAERNSGQFGHTHEAFGQHADGFACPDRILSRALQPFACPGELGL